MRKEQLKSKKNDSTRDPKRISETIIHTLGSRQLWGYKNCPKSTEPQSKRKPQEFEPRGIRQTVRKKNEMMVVVGVEGRRSMLHLLSHIQLSNYRLFLHRNPNLFWEFYDSDSTSEKGIFGGKD